MLTIVIVEDESIEREALRFIINKGIEHGVELLEAATGSEAIRLIDNTHIDLMLLDINIPHPNGIEVLKYLRSKTNNTKVIVTTAIDDFDIARNMIGLKVEEYLLKPIRSQVLIDHIKVCLNYDHEKYKKNKELYDKLIAMLENGLCAEWLQTVRDYINNIYSQQESIHHDKVSEFADIIKQIMERRGWHIEHLNKQLEQLKSLSFSRSNYYKVLMMALNISNSLFDEAHSQLSQVQDPMQKAFNYIERNLGKNLSLEEVSEKAHIAPSYLSRLFKKNAGINFVSYLRKRRIEIAKNLLDFSDMPIANIALELSYNDPNYFGRAFKEETGLTPSEYRSKTKI